MITCAVYARKSTSQDGVADEQKSTTRQVEHARAYAARKGWTIDESCIFVDDGISGAEFAKRPGFLRLMNSLKPQPAFQILIMSEESRLGREAIETAYALKQLVQAGVRVFFYLEDRERTLDSPTEKIMLSLATFADEIEREKARQRTYDAMLRKARAGHVTGGTLFGYDNVERLGADGKRSHVERRINEAEASVIREIFEQCARGAGWKAIAKDLNDRGLIAPRGLRARPRSWAPSTVREVMYRDTYRGLITWNRTKKRDAWGKKCQSERPATEWLTIPAEALRIVPEPLWRAAHERMKSRRDKHDQWTRNRHTGEPDGRGVHKRYLLAGFGRCHSCGGSMQIVSRASSGGRIYRMVCSTYWNRGAAACPIGKQADMQTADAAVKRVLADEVLRPNVIDRALDIVLQQLTRDEESPDTPIRKRLADVERKLDNLAETAARGGAVPVILEALARHERERQQLRIELAAVERECGPRISLSRDDVRKQTRAFLGEWDRLVTSNGAEARPLLDTVLEKRIDFRYQPSDHTFQLAVSIAYDRLLVAAVPAFRGLQDLGEKMASPRGRRSLLRQQYLVEIKAA